MKTIYFLGGLFPDLKRKEIESDSKGVIQYAADSLQRKLVKGLKEYSKDVRIVNMPFVGSFPLRYKRICMRTYNFSMNTENHVNDINLGFINLPLYKMWSRFRRMKSYLSKQKLSDAYIVIYSIHTPFLLATYLLKKRNPGLKVCIVVPDLPQYMSETKNVGYIVLKRLEKIVCDYLMKNVDGFIVLSKYMVSPLKINDRPFNVVEGIFDSLEFETSGTKNALHKQVFYSGTLDFRYGIKNLLDAFTYIKDDNFRLIICGEGEAKEEVLDRARLDKRIKYLGQIPREEVLKYQAQSTVLVNPRTSEGNYTKFSFPSKTMEYLASGTPTIISRLPGIPKEYFDYCIVEDTETAEGLAQAIKETCDLSEDELRRIGLNAKSFINKCKNPIVQGKKVIEVLEDIK